MQTIRAFLARCRSLFRHDAVAGEIRDELTFHFESRVAEYERDGLTREQALGKARARIGHITLHQDRGYDVRGGGVMETIWQDVRYALRLLGRQPGFAAIAILTLTLGIGASTAIFSVIEAAMLHPLPYPHPEQLVDLSIESPRKGGVSYRSPSPNDVRRWQDPDSPLASVGMWGYTSFDRVVDGPQPERVSNREISERYLTVLGLSPLLGRDFNADDMRPGAPDVALLGFSYWQRRFGGNRDVVGQVIVFDGTPTTVVGVLPKMLGSTAIYRPLRMSLDWAGFRGSGKQVSGRLRSGVTVDEARRQLTAMIAGFNTGAEATSTAGATSTLESTKGGSRSTVNVLAGSVGLILLIACVNVAGLLLARGTTRTAELAIRASIGAGRGRLIRQLMTESLLLSAIGCASGVLVAWLSLDIIVANIPLWFSDSTPPAINGMVLFASLALSVVTGILFGVVPAFRLSRVRVGAVLARTSRRQGPALSRRGAQLLIAVEVALAVILVAGAGLMVRSLSRLLAVEQGFDPYAIVTLEATPLDPNPAAMAQYYPALLRELRQSPAIAAAGAIDHLPLAGSATYSGATVDGKGVGVSYSYFLPGYFEALKVPIRAGRALTDADYGAGLKGAVLAEKAAREMFGDAPAIGRMFTINKTDYTVIGVVADIRHGGPMATLNSDVYLPFTPPTDPTDRIHRALALTIVVRPSAGARDLPAQLRRVATSIGPRVLVDRIRTGSDWMGERVVTPRRRTVLLSLLGSMGLLLTIVGVFGMTAYAVSRRTQEIGVRMAFGARPSQMVGRMLRDSAVPIVVGTIVGLAGATFATQLIKTFLFQTDPVDLVTFAVVAVVLVVVGCVAAYIPAHRAARVDPVMALRME